MSDHDDETRQIPPTPAPNDPTMLTPPISGSKPASPDAATIAIPSSHGSSVSRPVSASAAARTAAAPAAGARRIGDYDLESEIARGGMGIVYRARQLSLNRPVAFKMILAGQFASDADVERFQVEAEAAAGLDHPNIVPIYEVGAFEGNHFFTMKLIDGRSMAHEMPRLVTAPRDGVRMLVKVCRAIHYAHQHSILHRDLKPANILLDSQGEPHVTDFGLAKRTGGDSQLTQTGTIVGTPSYMAPEQAAPSKIPLTTAADVYSLGAMLYEVLTGRPPFKGDSPLDTLMLVLNKEPERPRTLNASADRDLETVALKCLEKDPARRYGSAEALAEDLDRWLAGEPILARPIGSAERVVKWAKRRPAIAALAVAMVAVTVLGVAGVVWQWREAVYQRGQAADALVRAEQEAKAAKLARDQEAAQKTAAEAAQSLEAIARQKADEQTGIAVNALASAKRSGYVSAVSLAAHEWSTNNVGHIDQLLASAPPSLRSWEWHYVSRLAHMETAAAAIGTKPIVALAVSPDGSLATTIGADLTASVYDLRARRVTRTVKLDGVPGLEIMASAISADGSRFAAATIRIENGAMLQDTRVWDTATGKALLTQGAQSLLVYGALMLTPDGTRLVTASGDSTAGATGAVEMMAHLTAVNTRLRVWDVRTGAELSSPGVVSGRVSNLVCSRDGRYIAASTGSNGAVGDVKILEMSTAQVVARLNHSVDARPIMSPDGRRVAVATPDGVRVWPASGGDEQWTRRLDATNIIAFSPAGQYVAVALTDRSIQLLDAATGEPRMRLTGSAAPVTALFFGHSDEELLSTDAEHLRQFAVRAAARPLVAAGSAETVSAAGVTPDRQRLIVLTRGSLRAWDLSDGHLLYGPAAVPPATSNSPGSISPEIAASIAAAAGQVTSIGSRLFFSADGRRTALVRSTSVTLNGRVQPRNGARVYDTATGKELFALSPAGDPPTASKPASAPVTSMLLAQPRGISLDGPGRQVVVTTMNMAMDMGALAAAGRGTGMMFNGSDIDVWAEPSERPVVSINLPAAAAITVEFSPDGRRLVVLTASVDDARPIPPQYRVYDTATGRLVTSFAADKQGAPIAFSRDSRLVAAETARHTVTIWNLDQSGRSLVLPEHRTAVTQIAFSPDGSRIVTLSLQGVTLFDARTGDQLLVLQESDGPYHVREILVPGKIAASVTDLAFSADGRQIIETIVAPDPKGIRVQIKTWEGGPKESQKSEVKSQK